MNAQLAYRTARTLAEQLGFSDVAGGAVTETTERTVRPLLALTWRPGISTSVDASTSTSDRLSSGNVFHTERDQQSGSLGFAFKPPAAILKLKNDVRTTARYSHAENTVCLRLAGQTTCVPYVDSRQTQMQLSLDTDLPPTLSAGFQMAYLVNEERQANRKTSQLVITAFVELHTSVGRIQ